MAHTKTIDIDGVNYTLTAKFGTLRMAEKELGVPVPKLFSSMENVGFDAISSLFWAFLQPSHRMTRDGSDNLIDQLGIEEVGTLVATLLSEYMDPGSSGGKGGNVEKTKPRQAGKNS